VKEMNEVLKCNRCGTTRKPYVLEGLCPRCLMALILEADAEAEKAVKKDAKKLRRN
jgi:Zn finger protein HypA/HybF involved in hydrogenase expression